MTESGKWKDGRKTPPPIWEDDPFEINRKVARVIGRVLDEVTRTVSDVTPWHSSHTTLEPEIEETDSAVVIVMDLPGVSVEDLELSLDGRTLHIQAIRRKTQPDGEVVEKKINREIALPAAVQEEDEGIEATLRDGVLTITLPKPDKPAGKRIKVKS